MKRPVIQWDGKNMPRGLSKIPPGRYRLEPADSPLDPSPEEDAGIVKALKQVDAGEGRTLHDVIAEIRSRRRRA